MIDLKQQTIFKNGKGIAAGALIGLMMTILIGVAVTISIVQDTTSKATTTYSMGNDTFNATASTPTYQNSLAGFSDGSDFLVLVSTMTVYNSSDCATDAFTLDADYIILANGTSPVINFTESTFVTERNDVFICAEYDYRSDSYVPSAPARRILGLFTLLIAVVLVTAITGFIS